MKRTIVAGMVLACLAGVWPAALANAAPRPNVSLVAGFDLRVDGAAAGDQSGFPVAGAGDVNGDGTDDLITGAEGADNGGTNAGASYVIYGGSGARATPLGLASLTATDGFRIDGAAANDRSGTSVAGAGDINGDGTDDLIVGAHAADNGGTDSGASYVIYGTTTNRTANINLANLATTDGFRIDGADGGDQSGRSVAGAGDINDDGTDDLIVGTPRSDIGGTDSGASYVIYGTTTNRTANINLADLATTDGFRIEGADERDETGFSVTGAGDVNGDGTDDLIVGAYTAGNGGTGSGSSYVIYGRSGPRATALSLASLTATDGFRIDGAANDQSGAPVDGAGDVNGDGTDDLIIGALFASNNGRFSGSSYVVYGRSGPRATPLSLASLTATDGFRIDGAAADDQSGLSVAGAGDVNGDGTDDLAIGAPTADNGDTSSGSTYVIYGRSGARPTPLGLASLTATDGFRIDGAAANDQSGYSVAGAGDFNDDGTDDLLIGAPTADNGAGGSGSSYLVAGLDSTAPAAPSLAASSPGAGAVTLSGTAEPGATIQAFEGSTPVGSTKTDANGNWSLQLTGVAPGTHTYTVQAADRAGNTSQASPPASVTVAVPPAGPAPLPAPAGPRAVPRDTIAPALSSAKLSTTRFAVNTKASAAARSKRARGATLTFRLSEPATVIFATQQLRRGKWRTIRVFTVKYRNVGRHTLNYTGRIRPRGKQRALKPGRYRLHLRPSDPAANRGTRTTRYFRIVR